MTNSIKRYGNLPPRQALLQLLAEKAKRERLKTLALAHRATVSELLVTVPSLVLDPTHPYHDLLHKRARYKVLWGGRGSGKSWAVAEALIRMASRKCVRVLCCREYQNSIKDSSHKILKDTIARLNLGAFFHVTADSIKSRTGSEFLFKGLFNNDESIKSTEGIDICWVEEAQTVSDYSWSTLIPTIRNTGSEIWVTYNLINEDDPTHTRFVVTPRTNSIVHKVNYDSNPFFWASPLAQEMEDDKRDNYARYEHIWLGMPLKLDDSIIYSGKTRIEVFDDELWRKADRLYFGLDFGFSQDPLALERCFIHERRLYVDHEAYGTGVELDEMKEFLCTVPGAADWPIKADNARPETISYLKNQGLNVSAADKWDGCVKDGITHIRKYEAVVIHPRCKGLAAESRLYRYKVDRATKEVLPIIIDKHNHAWDGLRYALDGEITRGGALGVWAQLG